jgi:hypothetical protein
MSYGYLHPEGNSKGFPFVNKLRYDSEGEAD